MMGSWEKLSSQMVYSQSFPRWAATACPFSLLVFPMNMGVQPVHKQSGLLVAQRAVSEVPCWSLQVGQPGQWHEGPQVASCCRKTHTEIFYFL